MTSARPQRRRVIVILLGLATLAMAGPFAVYAWRHRVELFLVPRAWRDVQRLADFGVDAIYVREAVESESDEEPVVETPLSLAVRELIVLQEPGFLGHRLMRLERIRTLDERPLFLTCIGYGEKGLIGFMGSVSPGTRWEFVHRVTDEQGRLLPEEPVGLSQICQGHALHSAAILEGLPVVRSEFDFRGDSGLVVDFIVGDDGWVCAGVENKNELFTPIPSLGPERRLTLPVPAGTALDLERWLRSSRPGDAFRALAALAAQQTDSLRALELLSHGHAAVRARAMAIVADAGLEHEAIRDALLPLINDPSPRVRLTAFLFLGVAEDPRVEPAARRLVADPHPVVRQWADFFLAGRVASDDETVRRSLFALVDSRFDPRLIAGGLESSPPTVNFARGSSPELARSLVTWFEEDLARSDVKGLPASLRALVEDVLLELDPAHLAPLAPRILALTGHPKLVVEGVDSLHLRRVHRSLLAVLARIEAAEMTESATDSAPSAESE